MTTTEKNNLLAEFIGLQTGKELGYDRWENDWFDNLGVINGQRNENLFFDSDWNWLMTVVSKVESICAEEKDFKNYFDDKDGSIISLFGELFVKSDIILVYTDLVNFITFYNKK
jgi:hypothetical protein